MSLASVMKSLKENGFANFISEESPRGKKNYQQKEIDRTHL